MSNTKGHVFCNNCGKTGHAFHQCKIPITSIGVIALRNIDDFIEVLMICRKDSLSFVDFMRGKYNLEDTEYIITNYYIFDKNQKNKFQLLNKLEKYHDVIVDGVVVSSSFVNIKKN